MIYSGADTARSCSRQTRRDTRGVNPNCNNQSALLVTWGLRKYAGDQEVVWGGAAGCEHLWGSIAGVKKSNPQRDTSGGFIGKDLGTRGEQGYNAAESFTASQGSFCSLCGAWRGAYGLEPNIGLYVQHTIEILRAIRRVMRKDGVVFLNLGDSYAGGGRNSGNALENTSAKQLTQIHSMACGKAKITDGLKPKDLCLIPQRVAIAAQDDGWWVRNDIIWWKPNPMPGSQDDRPTVDYEHILMLTKSKDCYWDQDAVREGLKDSTIEREKYGWHTSQAIASPTDKRGLIVKPGPGSNPSGRTVRSVWHFPTQGMGLEGCRACKKVYEAAAYRRLETRIIDGKKYKVCRCGGMDWVSHFAAFPEELPKRCILAASALQACAKCGRAWERVVEVIPGISKSCPKTLAAHEARGGNGIPVGTVGKSGSGRIEPIRQFLGFRPACACYPEGAEETRPSVILDCFAGSGTTLKVAESLGREHIGIELSADYLPLIEKRLSKVRGQKVLL